MGNEQYTTQQTTYSSASAASTDRALYSIERAKLLFGGYRRGDANDPELYVASIAAVLERYDVEIIREVTDPRTGISTTEKFMSFMPNSGELKRYCDDVAARRERMAELAALPRPNFRRRLPAPPKGPGAFATIFVHPEVPQYQAFMRRKDTADPREWRYDETRPGIWVAFSWFQGPADGPKGFKQFSADDLRAMYPKAPASAPELEPEIPF